ncbi:uncharacterized protein LOC131956109 isoform X2 [Physella acuta]|nr:uncharacterized protein LOC131956109 isoform X2 [Physella acuta]XP_059176508.1 uncharacterized protein LOC131956109 isoform X2 [Physella acuta]
MGDNHVLQLLIQLGAKTGVKKGMCYPEPHLPINYESSFFSMSPHPVYLCKTHRMTPVQCAIQCDHLACVQTILKHEDVKSPHELLMYACQEGSSKCIRYFVDMYPDSLNIYMNGDTPLLAAVPWGETCSKILLDAGADVHMRSESIQETALHRLYRQNIDGLFTIYDTTKYLLTTGIEQEVNAYTQLGETALHMLVSHVSYTGGNYVDPQRQTPRVQLQDSYQSQVLAALRLLLEFNADPTLLNSARLTPLSRLLHIGLKAVNRFEPCECVSTSQPDRFIHEYRHNYQVLTQALDVLLQFGADPSFTCHSGHTPLTLMLHLLLYDDMSNICCQHPHVVAAVEVLLQHGAQPNFTDGGQRTAYTLLAAICSRCLENTLAHNTSDDQALREKFGEVMNDVLRVFLQHGLEPNYTCSKLCQHLRGGQGNGLMEFVKLVSLASTDMEFLLIHRWLQTLLQWGADPDLQPYPAEPIICHCQSSIFLKKLPTQPLVHFIHEVKDKENLRTNKSLQNILALFYKTMDHTTLHQCLSSTRSAIHLQHCRFLNSTGSISTLCDGSTDLLTLVTLMSDNPRSLKELSRVAIYKSLDLKLASRVDQLPLPFVVKKYLLDIDT